MPKFFVEPSQIEDDKVVISGEDAKHIKTVLRSKINDRITICDGRCNDYDCVITRLEDKIVEAFIADKRISDAEPHVKITLFQSLPKADKMEFIIQKCVELGVDSIVPVTTERTIVKLDKKDKETKKIERWQKISESAAKQSGRGKIPEILSVMTFKESLKKAQTMDGVIIPYENETKIGLKNFVNSFKGETIGVFIGPEGGFAEEEIEEAVKADVCPITLGKRILRTETAGLTAVAIIIYELG